MNLFRKKQKGVSTIEFSIGFIFFWYMCAAWVEMSYMSYVSSLGDLAISRAAQVAKKYDSDSYTSGEDNFYSTFYSTLTTESGESLWLTAIEPEDFSVSVKYLTTYSDLVKYDVECEDGDSTCSTSSSSTATDAAIAIYSVTYNYKPIFNIFMDSGDVFNREMIVIQEYQRDQFAI